MKCPRCGSDAVARTRFTEKNIVFRRRRCVNVKCGYHFLTQEQYYRDCEGRGRSRVTRKDALEIKALLAEGILTQREIADRFDITQQLVSLINTGKRWGYIDPP